MSDIVSVTLDRKCATMSFGMPLSGTLLQAIEDPWSTIVRGFGHSGCGNKNPFASPPLLQGSAAIMYKQPMAPVDDAVATGETLEAGTSNSARNDLGESQPHIERKFVRWPGNHSARFHLAGQSRRSPQGTVNWNQ